MVFWNTTGSTVNAAFSFLVLLVTTRVFGAEIAGDFSIGYAIAQLMWTIGVFESTTYYVTDAKDRFSAEQYLAFKILTCLLMAIVSVCYVLSFGYAIEKSALALALCLFKLIDAFSSFYYASFQKAERLDISGFSLSSRMCIALICFTATSLISHNVLFAILVATASEIAWVGLYETRRFRLIRRLDRPDFSPRCMSQLFIELVPLFGATFLANYLGNIPKYAIDSIGTPAMQTIFNIVFMPSFVINLFVLFALRPTLTTLARLWNSEDIRGFLMLTGKLTVGAIGATAITILLSIPLGMPVLQLVFSIDLGDNLPSLITVILGGGIYAISTILYNCLVTMRRQHFILIAYAASAVVGALIAPSLVSNFGILGASATYLITSATMVAIYLVILIAALLLRQKKPRAE